MHLIELFLPLYDPQKRPFPRDAYEVVERELIAQFKGFTAYPRSPARGLWEKSAADVQHDELIIYEVMAETLDTPWWKDYRVALEMRFEQAQILIRAQQIQIL